MKKTLLHPLLGLVSLSRSVYYTILPQGLLTAPNFSPNKCLHRPLVFRPQLRPPRPSAIPPLPILRQRLLHHPINDPHLVSRRRHTRERTRRIQRRTTVFHYLAHFAEPVHTDHDLSLSTLFLHQIRIVEHDRPVGKIREGDAEGRMQHAQFHSFPLPLLEDLHPSIPADLEIRPSEMQQPGDNRQTRRVRDISVVVQHVHISANSEAFLPRDDAQPLRIQRSRPAHRLLEQSTQHQFRWVLSPSDAIVPGASQAAALAVDGEDAFEFAVGGGCDDGAGDLGEDVGFAEADGGEAALGGEGEGEWAVGGEGAAVEALVLGEGGEEEGGGVGGGRRVGGHCWGGCVVGE